MLAEFFSHGADNPHGWGLADLTDPAWRILREARPAHTSSLAAQVSAHPLMVTDALAHIRYATVGDIEEANCHPFVGADASGRRWMLMHKGTIFDHAAADAFFKLQTGSTDSERIFLLLLDALNRQYEAKRAPLEADERFSVLERVVCQLAPGNIVNLVIYDSDRFYVHTNYRSSLHVLSKDGRTMFSTAPLISYAPESTWAELKHNTLFAYRLGELVATGVDHGSEYVDRPEDTVYLYQDYAAL